MKTNDILYETGDYWVKKATTHKGFEVYRCSLTHSVRCGIIGYDGAEGLQRAIAEANKRAKVAS